MKHIQLLAQLRENQSQTFETLENLFLELEERIAALEYTQAEHSYYIKEKT